MARTRIRNSCLSQHCLRSCLTCVLAVQPPAFNVRVPTYPASADLLIHRFGHISVAHIWSNFFTMCEVTMSLVTVLILNSTHTCALLSQVHGRQAMDDKWLEKDDVLAFEPYLFGGLSGLTVFRALVRSVEVTLTSFAAVHLTRCFCVHSCRLTVSCLAMVLKCVAALRLTDDWLTVFCVAGE